MSFWITVGTLGWALGPLFATTTVRLFGLSHTWVAAIPGLLMSVVLALWFRHVVAGPPTPRTPTRLSDLKPIAKPLALLYGAVAARSAVSSGFATFLPLGASEQGWSVEPGGALTTGYLTLGALGGFMGGWVADRIGGRAVVRLSFLVAMPFFAAFFLAPQPWSILALLVGYFGLQASLPVNVVLGQELSPAHAGTISSLLMGAAWGLGSLLIGPVGAFADHAGGSLDEVWVMANLYESDVSLIKVGYDVEISTIAYPDRRYKGKIDKIFNTMDPEARVLRARITLSNLDHALKPEMFAQINVHFEGTEKKVAIPSEALIFEKNKRFAMVYFADDHIETREVSVFKELNGIAYLDGGVKAGERVMTKYQLLVYDALND